MKRVIEDGPLAYIHTHVSKPSMLPVFTTYLTNLAYYSYLRIYCIYNYACDRLVGMQLTLTSGIDWGRLHKAE